MAHELALSHYSRQWLGLIATKAKLTPIRSGQRWLLHLTPESPLARTITLQVRWSGVQWQLLSLTNAEDWHTMSQPVDEICVDPSRSCFWVSIHRNSIDTGKMRRSSLDPTFLLA